MKKDLSIELTSQLDYELLSAHSLAELTLILQNVFIYIYIYVYIHLTSVLM